MSYVLAFLGFAALIILHEAGHFAAAKAVGMRVERFSLFFGPVLWRTRRGETEYALSAIPLGGYVRITGMNPNEDIPPEHAARAYFRQPVWKRIVVILAGPVVNVIVFLALVFAILATQPAIDAGVGVGEIEHGTPASQSLKAGDRILSLDGISGYAPHQTDDYIALT